MKETRSGYFIEMLLHEYYSILYSENILFQVKTAQGNYYEASDARQIFNVEIGDYSTGYSNRYSDIHHKMIAKTKREAIKIFIRNVFEQE